jgi:pantoate--beta-alanine ligase
MQRAADAFRNGGSRIVVVPTMGALHEGHLSLIRIARKHGDKVVTTVFVNPTQFGPGEDFERYPRSLDRDAAAADEAGSDVIFAPDVGAMYPPEFTTTVTVDRLTSVLEGKSRPGHFRGVTTVVAKLFNIVKPHAAVFGRKDAQQVAVVRQLARDLNFDVEIIVAPIVREPDGLALSSRNVYLTPEQRKEAPVLYRALQHAGKLLREGMRSPGAVIREMRKIIEEDSSAVIDYISIADPETLQEVSDDVAGRPVLVSLAGRFGSTRLIDNIVVDR